MKFNAEINGQHVELDISANTLLVDLIRDNLQYNRRIIVVSKRISVLPQGRITYNDE